MTIDQITKQALALSLTDRVALAEELWHSIDDDYPTLRSVDEQAILDLAKQRDRDLSNGNIIAQTHEQVMAAARKALQ